MGGGALTLPQILSSSSCCWRERWARLTSWPESSSTFYSRVSDSLRFLSSPTLELRAESLVLAEEARQGKGRLVGESWSTVQKKRPAADRIDHCHYPWKGSRRVKEVVGQGDLGPPATLLKISYSTVIINIQKRTHMHTAQRVGPPPPWHGVHARDPFVYPLAGKILSRLLYNLHDLHTGTFIRALIKAQRCTSIRVTHPQWDSPGDQYSLIWCPPILVLLALLCVVCRAGVGIATRSSPITSFALGPIVKSSTKAIAASSLAGHWVGLLFERKHGFLGPDGTVPLAVAVLHVV